MPLLVLVSSVHYAVVLHGYDLWPVAVSIGLLVDIGHYRSVIVAVRYGGGRFWEVVARWVVALVMTGVSLSYHWRFYHGDWALAIPIPLLIGALAWFERVQRRPRQTVPQVAAPPVLPYECPICGLRFASQKALAGHLSGHARRGERVKVGGNGHERGRLARD